MTLLHAEWPKLWGFGHSGCNRVMDYSVPVLLFLLFQQVANSIGADPREIVFTSGATESNNIAVKGTGRFYKSKKKHVITTQTVGAEWEFVLIAL